jgi:hypothetical protein
MMAVPVNIGDARAFVDRHHRHHRAPLSGLFAIGCAMQDGSAFCQCCGGIVGVVIVGRPVARALDDEWTCEITRLACFPEARNAPSFLYRSAWRAARAMGYRKLVTYTLASEPGSSLLGAGFISVAEVRGRSWHTPSRPRIDKHPTEDKIRWEVQA